MEIQIQSIHFPPSEALNEKIEERLQKAFGKFAEANRKGQHSSTLYKEKYES